METNKIRIWGDAIPYNRQENKFQDEVPIMDRAELDTKMQAWFAAGDDPNRDPVIRRQVIMQDEIGKWGAKYTYEDEPFLLTFPVEGSDRAVLIVPGGAYVMKSMEHEGTEVARLLNQEGISAFVLWYRSYPYTWPVPYLDVQRAIRYLKFHASDYGYWPDKVSAMGFSAGGNAVAGSWQMLKGSPVKAQGYAPDEIDAVDDRPETIALIYGALEVSRDPQCLHMLSGKEEFPDAQGEREWIDRLDLKRYITPTDPPHFVCYGTADTVVSPEGAMAYCERLADCGVDCMTLPIEGTDHGFGSCENPHRETEFLAMGWQKKFAAWLKGL